MSTPHFLQYNLQRDLRSGVSVSQMIHWILSSGFV